MKVKATAANSNRFIVRTPSISPVRNDGDSRDIVAGMLNEPPDGVEACYVKEHNFLEAVFIWQRSVVES